MEVDLPTELRIKWSEAGMLAARAQASLGSAPPSLASSSTAPSLNLNNVKASVANIRAWCHNQRVGPQAQETFMLHFNVEQQRRRSVIQAEEAAERSRALDGQGAIIARIKVVGKLTEEEGSLRAKITSEYWDFMDFAKQKEPEWRTLATNKAALRKYIEASLRTHRNEMDEQLRSYSDFVVAVQFQEREDRDVAFSHQLQREEQANSEAYARQYERAQQQAQRDAELKRLQAIQQQQQARQQQQQQQQQQQPRYGYPANNNNFALPPPGLQGGGAGYSYNYGPGAGQTYGYNNTANANNNGRR